MNCPSDYQKICTFNWPLSSNSRAAGLIATAAPSTSEVAASQFGRKCQFRQLKEVSGIHSEARRDRLLLRRAPSRFLAFCMFCLVCMPLLCTSRIDTNDFCPQLLCIQNPDQIEDVLIHSHRHADTAIATYRHRRKKFLQALIALYQ